MTVRITENLSIDLSTEEWCCVACNHRLAPARTNYKTGCLVAEVPMDEAHPPLVEGQALSFTPHENEYLPPGHPLTHDIELDIDALKARHPSEGGRS